MVFATAQVEKLKSPRKYILTSVQEEKRNVALLLDYLVKKYPKPPRTSMSFAQRVKDSVRKGANSTVSSSNS